MTKKILGGTFAGIAILASALIALAETTSTTASTTAVIAPTPASSQQQIVQIGPGGKVLLRGTLASVGSGVLTVNSWGGTWTVNVGSDAQVLPAAAGSTLTQLKTGDFVGVEGTISQSGNWTINAKTVRDRSYRDAVVQQQKQNVQTAHQTIENGTARNFAGTVSAVGNSSFSLLGEKGITYTVNVAAGAQLVNRNWTTLLFSGIQSGDNVRVWGMNSSSTITAQIVRDMTLPPASSSTPKIKI